VTFPWTVYEQYFREHQYDLATQTFGPWFGEQIIALLVNAVASAVALMILYAVFRAAPRIWWMWGTGVAIVLLIMAAVVVPVFIAPLFNTYKPLMDPAIRDPISRAGSRQRNPGGSGLRIRRLTADHARQRQRVGFSRHDPDFFERQSSQECSLPEIRHVMSHEMGHFV